MGLQVYRRVCEGSPLGLRYLILDRIPAIIKAAGTILHLFIYQTFLSKVTIEKAGSDSPWNNLG